MLLSKLLHVAYYTQSIVLCPCYITWGCPIQKHIPVGQFWVDVPCLAWSSGHKVKFFLEEVGVMYAVFPSFSQKPCMRWP